MPQRIALAASGSENAESAEKFALDYCRRYMMEELLVIHILDTSLARYGEIDQLASGSCKYEISQYIREVASATSRILYSRILKRAANCGVAINWLQTEDKVLEQINNIVRKYHISTLIIGAGRKSKNFFAPSKKTVLKLSGKCACEVVIVPSFSLPHHVT